MICALLQGITTAALAKLGKDESVHLEIILKICKVMDYNISDFVETVKTEE